MADTRPDWLKAAAYEMDFVKNSLKSALNANYTARTKMKKALEDLTVLGKNLDEHLGTGEDDG
jgi:hypothetical protein